MFWSSTDLKWWSPWLSGIFVAIYCDGKEQMYRPKYSYLEFCWNSHACKGVPWVLWLILKSHHTVVPLLQLQGRCYTLRCSEWQQVSLQGTLSKEWDYTHHMRDIWWHCPDTKRHMHSHAILGTKIKKEQGFFYQPQDTWLKTLYHENSFLTSKYKLIITAVANIRKFN